MTRKQTKNYVYFTFFFALIILMTFTPIGFIQLGPIKLTLIHIPVILSSLLFGMKFGSILGFSFGLMSLIHNTLIPGPLSFAFSPMIPVLGTDQGSIWALVIAFLPRILVGVLPSFIYERTGQLQISILIGSLINTILVLSLIALIFSQAYASALSVEVNALSKIVLSVVVTNGLLEAALAIVINTVLYRRLRKII